MTSRYSRTFRSVAAAAVLVWTAPAWGASAKRPESAGVTKGAPVLRIPRVESSAARYAVDCKGRSVTQGLCLLGSTSPLASGGFVVRPIAIESSAAGNNSGGNGGTPIEFEVRLNRRLALAAGVYELFRKDGTDRGSEARFAVTSGHVFRLKTATLTFAGGGKKKSRYWLQHGTSRTGSDGSRAVVHGKGTVALLPGSYWVATATSEARLGTAWREEGLSRSAGPGGTAFHVIAGEAARVQKKAFLPSVLRAEDLPPGSVYRHPTGALALTSIGANRHEVTHVGLVSGFKVFGSIRNPSDAPVDALLLWGPHFAFAIPMELNSTESCGLSLAKGGLPSRNLLTHCKFDEQGWLTAFQVNARSYFGFADVSGQSEPGAQTVNAPVVATGMHFEMGRNAR